MNGAVLPGGSKLMVEPSCSNKKSMSTKLLGPKPNSDNRPTPMAKPNSDNQPTPIEENGKGNGDDELDDFFASL